MAMTKAELDEINATIERVREPLLRNELSRIRQKTLANGDSITQEMIDDGVFAFVELDAFGYVRDPVIWIWTLQGRQTVGFV